MAVDLEQELRSYLVDLCRHRVLDDKGQVRKGIYVGEGTKKRLPVFGGFIAPTAAYLARTEFDGNPFYGNDTLFKLAVDGGEKLVVDHAGISRKTKPNHFTIYPLGYMYELMGDEAPAPLRRQWRDTLWRNLQSVDAMIDRTWETLGKPGPWAGTGPNHFFGWFAVGQHAAQLLGEVSLAKKIRNAMVRHLQLQSPAGYFPEHTGPALGYQHVSLGGVADYHRLDPLAQTQESLHRGVDFIVRATYPDLRGIETFDERNRRSTSLSFQQGLLWTAQGRTLMARALAEAHRAVADKHVDGLRLQDWGNRDISGLYRCLVHAQATGSMRVAARLPIDQKRFIRRIEDKGLVRKEGPWFYAMSAWAHPTEQGNPYQLERTQALSIYHDAAGLIVGGGNDKRAYQAATIHVLEGKDCHYFPAVASKLQTNVSPKVMRTSGSCDRMEFDYGSVRATLEVRAESPARLRVALGAWASQTQPEIWLVLQLPVAVPLTLRNGEKPLRLKAAVEGQQEKDYPLASTIASPAGWQMSLPQGSSLIWPHLPWNPYRPPTYRDTLDQAVALVRLPLHENDWRVEVVLTATR